MNGEEIILVSSIIDKQSCGKSLHKIIKYFWAFTKPIPF